MYNDLDQNTLDRLHSTSGTYLTAQTWTFGLIALAFLAFFVYLAVSKHQGPDPKCTYRGWHGGARRIGPKPAQGWLGSVTSNNGRSWHGGARSGSETLTIRKPSNRPPLSTILTQAAFGLLVLVLAVGMWDLFWLSAGLGEDGSTWMLITPRISPWW